MRTDSRDRQTDMTQLRQKAIPVEAKYGPLELQEIDAPRLDSRYMKVVRLSALRTGYLYLLTPWSRVLLEKLTSKLCS